MALELDFKVSFLDDRTTILVEDTTGVYTLNNVTGWNAPNELRSDLALVCYIEYQPFNGDPINISTTNTTSQFFVEASTNTNVTFNLPYYKDGWYNIRLVAVPKYTDVDAVTNVTQDNIFYSLDDNELKFFNGTVVSELIDDNWETLKTSSYIKKLKEEIYFLDLTKAYNDLLEKYQDKLVTKGDYTIFESKLIQLKALMEATFYRFYSNKKYEAQNMTEKLIKQYL